MSSCLSKFVGRQSAGTATRAMPAREPAFIRKILRAPRHERDAVHTHTRLHDGPTQTMRLHTAADANLSKQDEEQRSWRRVETYTTMSHQHAAWSCPAWRRAAGRAETCAVDRCEQRRPVTGDRSPVPSGRARLLPQQSGRPGLLPGTQQSLGMNGPQRKLNGPACCPPHLQ